MGFPFKGIGLDGFEFIMMIQEQNQILLKQQEASRLRISIFFKIFVSVLRYFLYLGGYYFRQYDFSSSFISIFISLGVFLLAEILYWNRYIQGERKEFNMKMTVILHVSCLLNLLGMGFTFKYSEINPAPHYFLFEVGLLFNYAFSIIYICGVYFNSAVDTLQDFLSIRSGVITIDEPIDQSIQYIFIGLYIGSFFDMLAFLQQSAHIFYILNLLLIAYLLFNFLKSKSISNFRQAFTSQ